MWMSIAVVLGGVVAAGGLLRGLSWARRRRVVGRIDPLDVEHDLRGVSARILCQGQPLLPSMRTDKANRTTVDVLVTEDRLLVASSRGPLIDQRVSGRGLTSVRCPGPGRLVIEGEIPRVGLNAGSYRMEMVVEDASAWVRTLSPFTSADNGGFAASRS